MSNMQIDSELSLMRTARKQAEEHSAQQNEVVKHLDEIAECERQIQYWTRRRAALQGNFDRKSLAK